AVPRSSPRCVQNYAHTPGTRGTRVIRRSCCTRWPKASWPTASWTRRSDLASRLSTPPRSVEGPKTSVQVPVGLHDTGPGATRADLLQSRGHLLLPQGIVLTQTCDRVG